MATGCLSSPNTPTFKGLETFAGERYHTGHWPHEPVDFTGKRVAIIGTGSSAVQSIPIIAGQARAPDRISAHRELRRPGAQRADRAGGAAGGQSRLCGPARAREADHDRHRVRLRQRVRAGRRRPEEREREFERRWQRGGLSFLGAYRDLLIDADANKTAADFVRAKIHAP